MKPGRVLIVLAAVVVLLALVLGQALVRASRHYASTPDFSTYLRSTPVSDDTLAALLPAAELLSSEGRWFEGQVDPFEVAQDDPDVEVLGLEFEARIEHGDERLLDLLQEFALSVDAETYAPLGMAVRTPRCSSSDGVRAIVRLWIGERADLPSGGRYVTFEAFAVAGEGPDEVSVARVPAEGLPAFEPVDLAAALGRLSLFTLHPTAPLAEEGLIHRLRQRVHLDWERTPNGASGAGRHELLHGLNTEQYSYDLFAKISDLGWGGRSSTSFASNQTYEHDDRLW